MTTRTALVAAALSLIVAACRGGEPAEGPAAEPAAGAPAAPAADEAPRPAPEFTLPGPDGDFSLSDHRGQVVLLTFWASWSEPSMAALDTAAALAVELDAGDLVTVGVSQDEHGMAGLRAWAADSVAGAMVAVTLVSDSSHAVARQYGNVEMLPTTVVVDREGRLRGRHVGVLSADGLLDLLAPALIEAESTSPGGVEGEPAGVRALAPAAVPEMVAAGAALLDVREAAAEGTLAHATRRPLPALSREDLPANFAAPVIFLGETLAEAREAAERAAAWGYAVVYAVGGGEREWRRAGLEVVPVRVRRSGERVIG